MVDALSPTHILALASIGFASSMLRSAFYTQMITLLLIGVVLCTPYDILYVGMHNVNPWGIALSFDVLGQCACLAASCLSLVHLYERPEQRTWCTASLMACVGIALAADLFHMYVWLEVLTFASLGFMHGSRALRDYWRIHVFAAVIAVIGVLSIYQDTGTLTLPFSGARDLSVQLLLLGWCIKAGAGLWLLQGYDTLDDRDVFFVGSLFTKVGVLGVAKLASYLSDLNAVLVVAVLMTLCGCAIAMIVEGRRQFAGAHMLCQAGSALLVVALVQDHKIIAVYLLRYILAEAFLLSCLFSDARRWVHWCALLCVTGLPPSVGFVIKVATWNVCFSANLYFALCLAVANFGVATYLIKHAVSTLGSDRTSRVSRNLLALNVLTEVILVVLATMEMLGVVKAISSILLHTH